MQGDLLPLFPLNVVLFPRTSVPLHIFEERYKEMIGDVLKERTEFGVVLAREQGIVNIGCTATVEKIYKRYPDGRLDIGAIGRRRFELLLLNEEKSYLRGPVQFFDDAEEDPAPLPLKQKALDAFEALRALNQPDPPLEPDLGDSQLSFQLAQLVADLDFRQTLLAMRSESERLRRVVQFLEDYVPRQRYVGHIKSVAPSNGKGQQPDSLMEP
jgi:Lon protease-like protein